MKKNNTVIGSAVFVMIVVLLSKFLGFLRQVVIASSYGSNLNTDIYFLSSDFMIGLSGALLASLTTALVTIYIDISIKKDRNSANAVASKMLTLFLLVGGVFILLTNLFAPIIAKILAPSYTASDINILVKYLRIFSVTFIFTSFQSIYAAVLNANNSFVPGKLYGIVYNPIAIVMVLLFSGKFGINALVIAYFLGNVLQTLLLKYLCHNTFSFKPSLNFNDQNIKHLILLSLPLLLSNIFIQLNGIIDKAICSVLGEGIASNYSYAYTLEQFITATITATLSLILLSKYATYVAEENTEMVVITFKDSLSGLIILLLPITIIACVMSPEIVKIVYMRGQFDDVAAFHTSRALIGFSIGFGLIAIREMYIRLHFSYQDTKMPMIANISAVVLNGVLSLILAKYIGVMGVSLATSLSVILTIFLLNKSIKKYIPNFKFSTMLRLLLKLTPACIVTILFTLLLKRFLDVNIIIEFIICTSGGLVVYLLSLLLVKCEELMLLISQGKELLRNKFGK